MTLIFFLTYERMLQSKKNIGPSYTEVRTLFRKRSLIFLSSWLFFLLNCTHSQETNSRKPKRLFLIICTLRLCELSRMKFYDWPLPSQFPWKFHQLLTIFTFVFYVYLGNTPIFYIFPQTYVLLPTRIFSLSRI